MNTLKLGPVEVTRVVELEGPNSPRFSQAIFPALSDELIAPHREWLAPHFLDPESGRLMMSVHCFVVRTRHHTILVDTCVGNDKPRGMKVWNMRQGPFLDDLVRAGVRPDDVDYVLCTHMHVDHVGWNTRWENGRWVATFPKAKYLFCQAEWEHWRDTEPDDGGDPIGDSVKPVVDAGLARLVPGDFQIDDQARLVPTPGHTPGHVSLLLSGGGLSGGGEEAVITGDMIHHPLQFGQPGLSSGFDTSQEQAIRTRRAFIERYCGASTRILGTHFATPTAGRIVEHGAAFKLDVQV